MSGRFRGKNNFEREVRESVEAEAEAQRQQPVARWSQRPWVGGLFGAVLVQVVDGAGLSRWFIVLGLALFVGWVYWDWSRRKKDRPVD